MSFANKQEAFTATVLALYKQGYPSFSDTCEYVTPDKSLRCAVGIHLPLELCEQLEEQHHNDQIENCYSDALGEFLDIDDLGITETLTFWSDMQYHHDEPAMDHWREDTLDQWLPEWLERMRNYAALRQLTMPNLEDAL